MTKSSAAAVVAHHPAAILDKRVNILLVISSSYSNLQGDPDGENKPRIDPETQHGITTPQMLTRKIKDVYAMQGHEIHIARRAVLSRAILAESKTLGYDIDEAEEEPTPAADLSPEGTEAETAEAEAPEAEEAKEVKTKGKKKKAAKKGHKLPYEDKVKIIKAMASRYVDFRTFGGVLTTINEGVTGPCQVSFAVSVDPIEIMNLAITRVAVANEAEAAKDKDRTMGRLAVTPFGLYRQEITFTPHEAKMTGYTWGDLQEFLKNLVRVFDLTKSKSRSQVVLEKAVVFYHSSTLGDAPSHKLFRRVKIERNDPEMSGKPARSVDDYTVKVDTDGLPEGMRVEIIE